MTGHVPDDLDCWMPACFELECDGELVFDKETDIYTCDECVTKLTGQEFNKKEDEETEAYLRFFGYL
ncbi:hypothetical protein P9705_001281 [Enterococcus faecalis]|nr:hypothetical protein [Enterococcus faecalis]